jgi:hypothetical protein
MGVNRNEAAEFDPAHDPWIKLTGRDQQDVSTDDLVQWDGEAPQEIEWI